MNLFKLMDTLVNDLVWEQRLFLILTEKSWNGDGGRIAS